MDDIDKLFGDFKKDYGDIVYKASEDRPLDIVSTGSISLDYATGLGGVPVGTSLELFGPYSVGKTSLAYSMMGEVQKKGRVPALVNLEQAFDKDWASVVSGLDCERALIFDSKPGLQALELLGKLASRPQIGIVVLDSIGAMLNEKEQEIGGLKAAGGQAAMVTHMVKQIAPIAYANNCIVLYLNQIRYDVGGMSPMPITPGGEAVKHISTMRINLKRAKTDSKFDGKIDGEDIKIGFRVAAQIEKNKRSAPRRKAGWNFWNYPSPDGVIGIDRDQEILDLAAQHLFERRGGWYYDKRFPGGKLNGAEAVKTFIKANDAVKEDVALEIRKLAYQHAAKAVTEREVLVDV